MADTDFSRIGELFYKEVGEEENTSLEGFLKHAFTTYAQKYLRGGGIGGTKQITYSGMRGKLSLLIIPFDSMPDLSSMRIESETKDITALLKLLKGDISAEFSKLKVEDISEQVRKEISRTRKENYAQVSDMRFYFSLNPKTPEAIQRITLQNSLVKSAKSEEFEKGLAATLLTADHILMNNPFYADDDPNKYLINESCGITQPYKWHCIFDYSIKTVNNKSLPANLFQRLNEVFELAKHDFNAISYRTMKIEDRESKAGVFAYE